MIEMIEWISIISGVFLISYNSVRVFIPELGLPGLTNVPDVLTPWILLCAGLTLREVKKKDD